MGWTVDLVGGVQTSADTLLGAGLTGESFSLGSAAN